MVSKEEIDKQLKKIDFKTSGWGKAEIAQLPHIILEGEEIYECVNGTYEGGFALLLATDIRVLLIDKKPLQYLTVEDMRFDMISEMDYSHRLIGATINISAGDKALRFRSYNKDRLRKLIGHVQHCMAEAKKKESSHQEGQIEHLKSINNQLQSYLMAQQQYQQQVQAAQAGGQAQMPQVPEPPKLDNSLSDYLYAQSLLAQHQAATAQEEPADPVPVVAAQPEPEEPKAAVKDAAQTEDDEIYAEGIKEIYGKHQARTEQQTQTEASSSEQPSSLNLREVHPLQIAYAKLPIALRNRKFSKPSLNGSAPTSVPNPGLIV